jgi:hypothetical protein
MSADRLAEINCGGDRSSCVLKLDRDISNLTYIWLSYNNMVLLWQVTLEKFFKLRYYNCVLFRQLY